MNRSSLFTALWIVVSLAAWPAVAQEPAANPLSRNPVVESRLETARFLLARSGITATLSSDPSAVRNLAAAFREWKAADSSTPHSPESCLLDDGQSTALPAELVAQDLLPGQGARFGRALSLSFELKDLQDTFWVQGPNEDTPDPNDTVLRPVANTESYTPTVSFAFRPGDVLLSSADLALALTVMGRHSSLFNTSTPFDPERRMFQHFARSLRAGPRFLNALTFSGSVTQRPELPDGNAIPREYLREDKTATTWSIKFDPFLYFNPLAARKESYDAILGYGKLFGANGVGRGPDPCDPFQMAMASADGRISRICLMALSQASPRAAVWLPIVEFKSVDQFDFIRAGNQFLPAPEGDLETLTVTWDFTRMFGMAKARETALAIFRAHRDLQAAPPRIKRASQDPVEKLTVPKGTFLHRRLEADGGFDKITWRVEIPQGKKSVCAFPGVQLSSDGLLVGVPAEEGVFPVTLVASDGLQQESRQKFEITVSRGIEADLKEALMAKYLELAVGPEVITDDRWFDSLIRTWEQLNGGAQPLLPMKIATSQDQGSAH